MTGCARKFDENAAMSFIVKNKQLLKKHTKIWGKIEGLMKINFEVGLFMVIMINT